MFFQIFKSPQIICLPTICAMFQLTLNCPLTKYLRFVQFQATDDWKEADNGPGHKPMICEFDPSSYKQKSN